MATETIPVSTTVADNEQAPTPGTGFEPAADQVDAAEQQDRPEPARQPSISLQSKQRSESFRRGSIGQVGTDMKVGTGPLSPGLEVQDLYKKQAARIEELEQANWTLHGQLTESVTKLSKAEEELENLRAGHNELADLRNKVKDADQLSAELETTQRQLAQAQHASKASQNRRVRRLAQI